MHDLALKIISCFAVGLGKSPDYFEPWFKKECASVFRGLHYLPRSKEVILDNPNEQILVAPEHRDSGFMTLLSTFMYPGLQVLIDGEFKSIKSVKNAFVVNIGCTLEKISNFRIKATMHRVLDIGVERFSTPFFFEPKFSARISDKTLDSSRKLCEDPEYENDPVNAEEMATIMNYGQFMCKSKLTVGEWKGFVPPKISYDYSQK